MLLESVKEKVLSLLVNSMTLDERVCYHDILMRAIDYLADESRRYQIQSEKYFVGGEPQYLTLDMIPGHITIKVLNALSMNGFIVWAPLLVVYDKGTEDECTLDEVMITWGHTDEDMDISDERRRRGSYWRESDFPKHIYARREALYG